MTGVETRQCPSERRRLGWLRFSGPSLVFTKAPISSHRDVVKFVVLRRWPSRNKANKVVEVEGKDDVETGLAGCPALPSTSHRAACGDVMGVLAKMLPHIARQHNRPRSDSPTPPASIRASCFLGYDGGRSSSNPFAAVCLKSRLLFFAIVELSTFCIFLHPPSLHSRRPRGVVVSRSPPREPALVIGSATLRSIDLTSSPPLS